jgi:hypothetical protein
MLGCGPSFRYEFVTVQPTPKIKFNERHGEARLVINGFQVLISTGVLPALIEILRYYPRGGTSTLPPPPLPIITCRPRTSFSEMKVQSTRSIETGEVSK